MPLPKTPSGIKSLIERMEASLKHEKRTFGGLRDGGGLRYEIGPLYMLIDDIEGALNAFKYFEKNFPEDGGEPFHTLMWALTLFRLKKFEKAESKLMEAMLRNVYIIPKFIGEPIDWKLRKSIYFFENEEFCQSIPPEYLKIFDVEAIEWMRYVWLREDVIKLREKYIELQNLLAETPDGPRRNKLWKELERLREGGVGKDKLDG